MTENAAAAPPMTLVFVDSCAVNTFALLNLDPAKTLTGSRFQVAMTPDLEREYRQGLQAAFVEPHIKALLRSLLDRAVRHGAPESVVGAFRGTDVDLVTLSQTQFVITLDTKPPWTRAIRHPGLLPWPLVETGVRQGLSLEAILQTRASRLV